MILSVSIELYQLVHK